MSAAAAWTQPTILAKFNLAIRRAFFSEEKNQKTFIPVSTKVMAMASIDGAAEKEKSFASFLQKRRRFLNLVSFC
jgi:hypothetical protein